MKHCNIDFETFSKLSINLLMEIKEKRNSYKAILCPLRGGYYLSDYMSRKLKLPVLYIEISSYESKMQKEFQIGLKPELAEGKFLLCDDIFDSGKTIEKIHSMYPHVDFDTCCLISKVDTNEILYGKLVVKDEWVDFFWEVME